MNMALDGADYDFQDIFKNESQAGTTMSDHPDPAKCADDTQIFTIHLPCRLAKRAEKYAQENGNTFTGVVIEALDALLRGQKTD